MSNYFFVMLGYPGSGKSTFARQLATELSIVRLNGDGARHLMFKTQAERDSSANSPMVFGALDYATTQILRAGYGVVYDVNHNRRADRAKAEKLGEPYGVKPIIVWVQISPELVRARLESREITSEQPKVPLDYVDRVMANREEPDENELCIYIDGTLPFQAQLTSFKSQLEQL